MRSIPERRFTVVSFHAHPDDEALLTGGTLAQLAAAGHRVVLVLATAGEAGLADSNDRHDADLGDVRLGEVNASARALGVDRVVMLGYADSGFPEAAAPRGDVLSRFAEQDVESVACRLAEVCGTSGQTCSRRTTRRVATGTPTTCRCTELARWPLPKPRPPWCSRRHTTGPWWPGRIDGCAD